ALATVRLLVGLAELLLGNIAVIALQLLLGAQLEAEVGHLALAPLAMLAGAVLAPVHRRFRPAPDVLAHTAIDLVFRGLALAHSHSLSNSCTRNLALPGEGNAPSSGLLVRGLTGFPAHALLGKPRDTSKQTPGAQARCLAREIGDPARIVKSDQSFDLCSGFPLRLVEAISSSCFSLIDSYMPFEAPVAWPFLVSPRWADKAAPAAFCWAFDFAGITVLRECGGRPVTQRARNGGRSDQAAATLIRAG